MAVLLNGTNGLIQAYDYQTPTTGYSYVFAAGTQVLVMNPAGTLAAVTITMPASPSDGMTITFSSTKQITALTLNGNTGQTIVGGVNSLAPYQVVSFIYRSASTTWLPMATQVAQATGPAVRAYLASNQSISGSTITKVTLDTESFDTASCFNNTGSTVGGIPAYSFLPNVAGYYQVAAYIYHDYLGAGNSGVRTYIYKNGSLYTLGAAFGGNLYATLPSVNDLIYMNGTTDYLEMYGWSNHGTPQFSGGTTLTHFSAALVRAA